MSKSTSWREILLSATGEDSKGKAWKTLTVQAIVQPLSSVQLPIGRQKRLAESSKKTIRREQELTYRFSPLLARLNGVTLFYMVNTNLIEIW